MSAGHDPFDSSALTIAFAALGGVSAQVIGRHVGLPGIVLLLGAGVALGPDGANIVRPALLGSALQVLVGFAVAVILFEGGLALNLSRLSRAQKPVRRLVTIGAVVTLVAGTLVAKLATGWPWKVCILFGTLIIVTGPTVVTPLLKRLNVEARVSTVLEAEGVLIDAVGAVTAAVALEVAMSSSLDLGGAVVELSSTLGFGLIAGLIGGGLLALTLGVKGLVPEGLENVFSLAFVLALFQVTNAVFHESGIAAVTVAGIMLARTGLPAQQELHHFKEQLTAMLIGMLFILLAADVRLADIQALGWAGVLVGRRRDGRGSSAQRCGGNVRHQPDPKSADLHRLDRSSRHHRRRGRFPLCGSARAGGSSGGPGAAGLGVQRYRGDRSLGRADGESRRPMARPPTPQRPRLGDPRRQRTGHRRGPLTSRRW